MRKSPWKKRRGVVAVLVAIAMVALLGLLALSLDVGRMVLSAQFVQTAADGTALAAAVFPIGTDTADATARADAVITADQAIGHPHLSAGTPVYYEAGQTVPGFRLLKTNEEAVAVSVQEPIKFYFAPIAGVPSTTVTRTSTAARLFAQGEPMVPMWIGAGTPLQYGVDQNLSQANVPPGTDNTVPGNFGWLTPDSGQGDFDTLLRGYNVSLSLMQANWMEVGNVMSGLTGMKVGHWVSDLGPSVTGRLTRCTWDPWTNDTFYSYHYNNPRIIVVPMVEYVGYNGTNALWKIDNFGVFWLDSINSDGQNSTITGKFIDYVDSSGANGYTNYLGTWQVRLVK